MPNYNKGKIYTIRCHDDQTLIYVGSTTQTLSQRWNDHKTATANPNTRKYNTNFYRTIREKGVDTFYMELYEEYPCQNKQQLEKREGEIIRQIGTLNKQITGRTKKEYYLEHKEENKEHRKEKGKQYYEQNKEKINEKKREKHSCECGCIIMKSNICYHLK